MFAPESCSATPRVLTLLEMDQGRGGTRHLTHGLHPFDTSCMRLLLKKIIIQMFTFLLLLWVNLPHGTEAVLLNSASLSQPGVTQSLSAWG